MSEEANLMSEHKRAISSRLNSLPLTNFSNLAQSYARRFPGFFRSHAHELDASPGFNGKLFGSNYHRQPTEMAARSFELIGAAKGVKSAGDFRLLPQAHEADEALASIKTLLSAVESHFGIPPMKVSAKLAKLRSEKYSSPSNTNLNNNFAPNKSKKS